MPKVVSNFLYHALDIYIAQMAYIWDKMHLLQSGYLSHFRVHWQRPIWIQVYVGQSVVSMLVGKGKTCVVYSWSH